MTDTQKGPSEVTTIPHGTLSGRKYHKCTCPPCVEAGRAYARRVHRQRGYGTWQPLVDAEPVREHVLTLIDAGINLKRVGQLAGVTHSVVERLVYSVSGRPRTARLRPDIAEKLRTVPAIPSPRHRVDGAPTRRRVQALVAAGWNTQTLAPHFGLHPRHANELLRARSVLLSTAQAVAQAYARLAELDPVAEGVAPWVALRSQRQGAKNGWPPPAAWIDDDLDAAEESAPEPLTRAQCVALARDLTLAGATAEEIAAQINRTPRTVWRWQAEHGWKDAAA